MEITQTRHGDVVVLALNGRLDAHTAPQAEAPLLAPIEQGAKQLLVDFSRVDYISSAGLRVLLVAARTISENDGKIVLCGLKPAIKSVFDIAGFSSIFPIFASQQEAFNHFMK